MLKGWTAEGLRDYIEAKRNTRHEWNMIITITTQTMQDDDGNLVERDVVSFGTEDKEGYYELLDSCACNEGENPIGIVQSQIEWYK